MLSIPALATVISGANGDDDDNEYVFTVDLLFESTQEEFTIKPQ